MMPKDGLIRFKVSCLIKIRDFPALPVTAIANGNVVIVLEETQRLIIEYGITYYQLVMDYQKDRNDGAIPDPTYDFTAIVRKYYADLLKFLIPVEQVELLQLYPEELAEEDLQERKKEV